MSDRGRADALAGRVIGALLATAGDPAADDHFTIARWEWPQGVALYAMWLRASRSRDEKLLDSMREWYSMRLAGPESALNVNANAPYLALLHLARRDGNRSWLEACERRAARVYGEMPRTEEGGIQHVTADLANPGQLWADTLFMTALFLGRAGEAFGRREWTDDAVHQFLLHAKYLVDTRTGLWFHGFSFEGRHNFAGLPWARGNAWFTMGAVELLESSCPPRPGDPGAGGGLVEGGARLSILETLRSQARALVGAQDESGLWNTILGDRGSYLETSASAAFAYALLKGARLGFLGADEQEAGERAARAVAGAIGEDGVVAGVSHGTAIGMDRDHYLGIRRCPTAYGQGLAYLMLGECGDVL
jgi:unsaturated rhamnogalacturonyl hydrolase